MKNLLLILISFAIFSCNSGAEKKVDIFEGSKIHAINFLKKEVFLPNNFEKINLHEIGEMLRQNPDLDPIDRIYYEGALRFQVNGAPPELFTNASNKTNTIWFLPAEYMVLHKEMVGLYVQMLEQSQIPGLEAQGLIVNRLESKFLSYKNTKAIKVKYEQVLGEEKRYTTQYIVTYKFDTFSISVSSDTEEDYQYILNNFSTY